MSNGNYKFVQINIKHLLYFDTTSVEGLKSKIFLSIPQLCFTIKECKIDFLTIYDSICQFGMPAHNLSVQNADNTSDCKYCRANQD